MLVSMINQPGQWPTIDINSSYKVTTSKSDPGPVVLTSKMLPGAGYGEDLAFAGPGSLAAKLL